MIDASVIGYGTVGKATAKVFGITKYYDKKKQSATLEECAKSKFVFICLPTPTEKGVYGVQDQTAIAEVLSKINKLNGSPIVIIRSTVLPGTADKYKEKYDMKIVSNPEFGSEDTMENDMASPIITVVGGEEEEANAVAKLYKGHGGYHLQTDNITAEIIKYALNVWFATKVVYGNLIYDICEQKVADYKKVEKVFELHPWVGKNHWETLHKGYRGFGGKCLPKDVEVFSTAYPNQLVNAVLEINKKLIEEKEVEKNNEKDNTKSE